MKIIGISSSLDSNNHCYAPIEYARAVEKAGAIPLILPMTEEPKKYMKLIDGLILIGGHDISPRIYGQKESKYLKETFELRDTYDIKLFQYAKELGMPILGVCRGLQLINALMGGSLYQDLTLVPNNTIDHTKAKHPITKLDGFIKKLYNDGEIVNSKHHQCIQDVAPNFKVCAKSSDGIIEAIESSDLNILAVQWHPELLESNQKLFNYFITKVNEYDIR